MSGQPPQRVRRNPSPSTAIQRPMKAIQAFALKGSPTRKSPTSSPTTSVLLSRLSPDNRNSPERKSPGSPSFKVERPKAGRVSNSPLKRTGSLEALYTPIAYLKGQWPSSSSHFMVDACTQTEEADVVRSTSQKSSKKKKSKDHRRSRSFGPGDNAQLALIRQRLQKSKEGSKSETHKLRQSPVPGNHQALSSTAPAALQNLQIQRTSKPLGIPSHIPKTNMSRYQRNSVEGLSTEIEKLVLRPEPDVEESEKNQDIPDGHRAPIPEVSNRASSTRSVDTQTPSGCLDDTSSGSRSHSVSPAIPIIPGHMDSSRPSSGADSGGMERSEKGELEGCESPESPQFKVVSSPQPNKSCSFVREPPDGCEKIKVISEEMKKAPSQLSQPSIKPLLYCPIKPSQFVLKPSVDSAFCQLRAAYTSQGTQSTATQIAVANNLYSREITHGNTDVSSS